MADRINNASLRKARFDDMDFIYNLRNDLSVRKYVFDKKLIPYEKHVAWYKERWNSHNSRILVLELKNKRIGQIRLDIDKNRQESRISYAIAEPYRGRGFAKEMLTLLELSLKEEAMELVGEVVKENIASQKVFRKLKYEEKETGYGYEYRKRIIE